MVRPAAHSFPHRGSPSTSHTRVRWQPYHASLQSIPPRISSPLPYLVTPASSTSSVSPSPRSLSESDRPRYAHHPPREPKLRDNQKSKFALSLVDRAVTSLCDIWPQQDIPTVFLTSGRPTVSSDHHYPTANPTTRNTYLPSPISPTTHPTPPISPVAAYSAQPAVETQLPCPDVAPMKGFVHEVLRRSRTSGTVLQTALCYLEAIRSKIPDLVRKEKHTFSSSSALGSDDDRISQGEVGIDFDTDLHDSIHFAGTPPTDKLLATVRVDPVPHEPGHLLSTMPNLDADRMSVHGPKTDALPPLLPLPSPLLCPRRAFLASLILASKFIQDRCYSNRAWAKLSGLPPREIGRCERALGEALEWRLWVGKLPAAQSASRHVLTKSRSETDILLSGNSRVAGDTDLARTSCNIIPPKQPRTGSLKRCATLPAGNLYVEDLQVTGMDNVSPSSYSSSPSTPGLSYSPTPTESSLGDRTVQMTTFMDVSTPPPGQFATFTGAQNDKVPAAFFVPSTGLLVPTSLQDTALAPLLQRVDSHHLMSHGALAPHSVWMFNDEA